MRIKHGLLIIIVLFLHLGCANDGHDSANNAITQPDLVAYTDEVIFLLTVQIKSVKNSVYTSAINNYLLPTHIKELSLYVENDKWGTFSINSTNQNDELSKVTINSWKFNTEKNSIIVTAKRENNNDLKDTSLITIGDWVDYLSHYIAPGDHIFYLKNIKFEDSNGTQYGYRINTFSFAKVTDSSTTLSLGEINIEIYNFGE